MPEEFWPQADKVDTFGASSGLILLAAEVTQPLGEEAKALGDGDSYPRPTSWQVAKAGFKPHSVELQSLFFPFLP